MDASTAEAHVGGVSSSLMLNRHIPRRAVTQARRRSFNQVMRASAKRIARGQDAEALERLSLPGTADDGSPARGALGPQIEGELRRRCSDARPSPRLRCRHRPSNDVCVQDEADEGRDLAHSEIPLPSDRFRLGRPLPLEREDAFRDASTSTRGKVRVRRSLPDSDDGQVAELYNMGLLYDDQDESARRDGDALNLNSIQHEEPVYSIRPDRRVRRPTKPKAPGYERPLHLDLSFTDLGEDTAIAQYLAAPASRDQAMPDGSTRHAPRQARSQAYAPLRVIYELAGVRPNLEAETSQLPELVTDLLSDYDCFSDSELDDGLPSQREVHELGDHASSETWVVLGKDS